MRSGVDPAVIESQLKDFLSTHAEQEGIAAAYLFGSVARGTAKSGDVAPVVRRDLDPTRHNTNPFHL